MITLTSILVIVSIRSVLGVTVVAAVLLALGIHGLQSIVLRQMLCECVW